ncbi:transporter [Methylobacterium sp. J-043]|uniref:transporter n=1 Tax=Methylorubrum TaxID=2282523 RepID=UPI00209E69EB|nr:transporter [Methylobacterium sp. J-043]MCP1550311.1 hypothetical protein [Methylorubrum zatmanii]MCP1553076.1 hypothetical protein [Methylorubrum extorquens]MCP1580614.1 hypothetical protein [Methylorubrum extorquens]
MRKYAAFAISAAVTLGGLALQATATKAADITFGIIGPREYELPVNYKDFFAFVQYTGTNSTSQFFDQSGNLSSVPRQNLTVGLSKFVWFTTIDSLPGVGIALEAILPEVYLGTRGAKERFGFGDTIWGFATWIKPTDNSTLGFQSFIQAPIGGDYFTNRFYANYSSILFDVQGEHLSFTGDVGGVFRGDQDPAGPGGVVVSPGTTFHTNLRLGYKLGIPAFPVEPFLALDYQYNTAARVTASNLIVPNSQNQDLALGAGLAILYDPKQSFTIRYSRSVYGENTFPTNAVFLKYVYIP